jgi:hypothetical protein
MNVNVKKDILRFLMKAKVFVVVKNASLVYQIDHVQNVL